MTARKYPLLQSVDAAIGPWLCRHSKVNATALRLSLDDAEAPVRPDAISTVLVIRPGGLGDAALTYPMLKILREDFPAARIDVLAEKRNAGIYSIERIVDEIHCYDVRPLSTFRRLQRIGYDLVIDTEQYHHLSTIFANALRPRYLCGFDTLGRGRLQTHSVAYSEDEYEVLSFLKLAESLLGTAARFDPDRAFITVDDEYLEWANDKIRRAGMDKFAAVTPVASSAYRLWPAERYSEVVAWLNSRNIGVILLGGVDGLKTSKLITASTDPNHVTTLVGQTTLAESAAILQRACLSLSADTGIMHVARGVGTPTVALFGPGLYRKWAPPGGKHRIIRKGLECSPCTRLGRVPPCPHGIACMKEIGVNDVIAVLEEMLEESS